MTAFSPILEAPAAPAITPCPDQLRRVVELWTAAGIAEATPLELDGTRVRGHFDGMTLDSVYQPLFAADTLRPRAFEALLRPTGPDGSPWAPPRAFAACRDRSAVVAFDRLCRVLHVLNFTGQTVVPGELWLNVSADHLVNVRGEHGQVFEALLKLCGLTPGDVVLEILESRIDDLAHLSRAVNSYRQRGYRVALDDFGARHSNFDRLWMLEPDIVKLDRAMIVQGVENARARRILPRLIDIIHELGAVAVCEGIETAEQLALARGAGADLVQGYFLSRPGPLAGHAKAQGEGGCP